MERGAPAPLLIPLIDTTCASAKVWYSPSAAQKPALMKPCSSMPNLLRPFRGAPVHFCSGVLRTPSVFPQHGCNKTVLQMRANDTRRSQTAATALQMSVAALVRARNNSELISGMKHKYLSAPSTLPPKRKTTKYPIALFNPPSHDGGYHNGGYCIPARGALGCRSSATETVARRGRLERGHLGRSALQNGWSVAGAFFRPGQLRNCEIRGCSSIKRSGCFCGRGRPRAWPDLARAVVAALVRAQKIR